MAFPWAAAIAAGGSVLSSIVGKNKGTGYDYDDARSSMELQKELYDWQFRRQLEAQNSAHQREVEDMRKAGLNPILSATGGSGLSSPTGSMPDISSVNSAGIAAKQANRQMKANMILGIADALIRAQANEVNDKSADAALSQAETAKENAKINMMNAEQNAINTGSLVQQRIIQNANLDADTKKKLYEMNLMNSQMYLNSAYANKAMTDAYIQKELLPFQQRNLSVSGGYPSFIVEEIKQAEEWVKQRREQVFNSAKEAYDAPTTGILNLYKPFKYLRKFLKD